MTTKEDTVKWNEAVDAAFIPTDLDRKLGNGGAFGLGDPVINEDGKVADPNLVRERAAVKYIDAHAGEWVTVTFCDPAHVDDSSRQIFTVHGILHETILEYPTFNDTQARNTRGIRVTNFLVPLRGVSSIRIDGDNSTLVL